MTGNAVALNDGVIVTGGQVFLASITLNETQQFTAPLANAGANITSAIALNDKSIAFDGPGAFLIGGTISGSGSLLRLASGVTILTANNSYTGQTLVNSGEHQQRNGGAKRWKHSHYQEWTFDSS